MSDKKKKLSAVSRKRKVEKPLMFNTFPYEVPEAMKALFQFIEANSEYTATLNEDGSVTHEFKFRTKPPI